MISDVPDKLDGNGTYPWTNKQFMVDASSKKLDEEIKDFSYICDERHDSL
jgi:hypothetical protein